jgi:hypothetical protein
MPKQTHFLAQQGFKLLNGVCADRAGYGWSRVSTGVIASAPMRFQEGLRCEPTPGETG